MDIRDMCRRELAAGRLTRRVRDVVICGVRSHVGNAPLRFWISQLGILTAGLARTTWMVRDDTQEAQRRESIYVRYLQ